MKLDMLASLSIGINYRVANLKVTARQLQPLLSVVHSVTCDIFTGTLQ